MGLMEKNISSNWCQSIFNASELTFEHQSVNPENLNIKPLDDEI